MAGLWVAGQPGRCRGAPPPDETRKPESGFFLRVAPVTCAAILAALVSRPPSSWQVKKLWPGLLHGPDELAYLQNAGRARFADGDAADHHRARAVGRILADLNGPSSCLDFVVVCI